MTVLVHGEISFRWLVKTLYDAGKLKLYYKILLIYANFAWYLFLKKALNILLFPIGEDWNWCLFTNLYFREK